MTTTDNSRAFFASALLHGTVLAIALYFSYAAVKEQAKQRPVLELVAGGGDNFRATEAPAIGVPGGVKLTVPKATPKPVVPEAPQPETPKPETPKSEITRAEPPPKPEPSPLTKAPVTTTPPTQTKQRTMAQTIRRQLWAADSKGRKQAKKEIEAERVTKEEFDRKQNAKKVASVKTPPAKIEKIDSEGIAKGVVGGSTKNKTGGAGGNALSVEERSEADAYAAFLNQKLTEELDSIPGLDENLRAEAEFEVLGNGRLTRGRIIKRSGNERFDQAVLHAIAAVRMPEGPPKGFERVQQVAFSSKGMN